MSTQRMQPFLPGNYDIHCRETGRLLGHGNVQALLEADRVFHRAVLRSDYFERRGTVRFQKSVIAERDPAIWLPAAKRNLSDANDARYWEAIYETQREFATGRFARTGPHLGRGTSRSLYQAGRHVGVLWTGPLAGVPTAPVPREHEGALVVGHFAEHWVLLEGFSADLTFRIHVGGGVDEAYVDFVEASRGVRGVVGHVVAGSVLYGGLSETI